MRPIATGLTNSKWLGLKHSERWIGRPDAVFHSSAVSEMIFHVAAADVQFGIHIGKLAKNPLRAFAHDIGQHVQPTAMGHAEHDFTIPCSPAFSIARSNSGIKLSAPSSEKLFAPRIFAE